MSANHHDLRRMSDLRSKAHLSRLLAERRAEEAAREAQLRRLPTPRTQRPVQKPAEPFGWVDSAVFLLPLAIVAALILVARWSGWLS